jgi:hypothetical protein
MKNLDFRRRVIARGALPAIRAGKGARMAA